DAWIKYYRQDENSPNSVVSYYVKGSLVALCLDLTIRARTGSRRSLDDVMRLMWQRYGTAPGATGTGHGLDEAGFPALLEEATGVDLSRQIARWAYRTAELPLADCLRPFGIDVGREASGDARCWLGARTVLRHADVVIHSA